MTFILTCGSYIVQGLTNKTAPAHLGTCLGFQELLAFHTILSSLQGIFNHHPLYKNAGVPSPTPYKRVY